MINEVFDDSSITEIEKVFNRVHEQPIYTQKKVFKFEGVGWDCDQIVDSHKAICNPDGDVIAVVGKGYKLIQNADILPEYEKAIYRSGLDTTGMKRDIKQSHFGARTVCTYTFPAHKVEVRSGDFIALQISVLNSYDGSWKFMSLLVALPHRKMDSRSGSLC